jgi:triacylglycerol esterase/lipase EstA (alpha/beta hydrolase family)
MKKTQSIKQDRKSEGLHIVREENKEAAIIFVHGLGGGPYTTWTKKKCDSLPDLLKNDASYNGFDLYTFGYKSGFVFKRHHFKKISDLLFTEVKVRVSQKEIYFITHSMGGIVVQRMLIEQVERNNNYFIQRVMGIVYLAVPFAGSKVASIVSKAYAIIPPFIGEYAISVQVRSLNIFSDELSEQTEKWFRYTDAQLSHIREKNIYGQSDRVVASASSKAGYIKDTDVVEKNHRSISKIENNDLVYRIISNYFREIIDNKHEKSLEIVKMLEDNIKILKEQFGNSKEQISITMEKWKAYKQELYSNTTVFFTMENLLHNVLHESTYSFEAIEVGIRQIKRGAWAIFDVTEAKIVISFDKKFLAINFENQLNMSYLNIQTSIAEWKRQYEVREKIGETQIIKIFNETKMHIENLLLAVIWKMEAFEELDDKLDDKQNLEELLSERGNEEDEN